MYGEYTAAAFSTQGMAKAYKIHIATSYISSVKMTSHPYNLGSGRFKLMEIPFITVNQKRPMTTQKQFP